MPDLARLVSALVFNGAREGWWWWYHCLTAHQHQKGHTVPKQVIMIEGGFLYTSLYIKHEADAAFRVVQSDQRESYILFCITYQYFTLF